MSRTQATFELAAAGDAMITRRLSTAGQPEFDRLTDHVRAADASILNLEVLLHNYESPPAANGPGTYMRAPRWAANELTDAGFDAFTAATNHAIDYGHGGIISTIEALESRNIPFAGLGRNLEEARTPCYVDTPAGRVAIVGACATVTTGSEAGTESRGMVGRPGISPLGHDVVYRVPSDVYGSLKRMSEELGFERFKNHVTSLGFPIEEPERGFRLLTVDGDTHPRIERGDDFAVYRIPDESDTRAVLSQVTEARRQADWVIASLHYHEGDGARGTDQTVPAFVEAFARDCVDSGADAFVGHGSHCLRGFEVYDGAPVFYSLGNFVAQNDLVDRIPEEMYERYGLGPDATPAGVFDARSTAPDGSQRGFAAFEKYYETVLPVCTFTSDGLESVNLYPVDLQREADRAARGQPILASGDRGVEILDRAAKLAESYGTDVAITDETATVELQS